MMFCNYAAKNRFLTHNLNLEGYKIKSTLSYKIFLTLTELAYSGGGQREGNFSSIDQCVILCAFALAGLAF